ncbi:MAG TPA: putative dsRNA-binding protein [Methanolinea sp.]|nr:putative dsRNA-binding protein [Methanolinea sp.]HQK55285.1 putative dsRNA-binding protein [Methanolinea sp.]
MEKTWKERLTAFLKQPLIGCTNPSESALARYTAAFTHQSFLKGTGQQQGTPLPCEDYERLEFLGDRVLNLVVAEHLFFMGHENEGSMTSRMEVVKNQNLGAIVPSLGIGFPEMIRVGQHQQRTTRIIAGSFEAFIGAHYLENGLDSTRRMIIRLIGDDIASFSPHHNYKKILQEEIQGSLGILPVYVLHDKKGPDHKPEFVYQVFISGTLCGEGRGANKAEATQNAAWNALQARERRPHT